jgi:hypothetical protein
MGGKAFDNTSRIKLDDIEPTLKNLERHWGDYRLNGGHLKNHMLGSAGKKPESGDIDLNMDINAYDQEKVAKQLESVLGADNVKARPGNNQIFTSVPVPGTGQRVQIDFMFGDYDWQEFSYHSPKISAFKGLYRTELIKALVAFLSDWSLEENDELIARVGPTFFHDRGCVWRCRHRPMRKDGEGRIKQFKELPWDEFKKIYPSAIPPSHDVMIKVSEVQAFLCRVFRYELSPGRLFDSFESLLPNLRCALSNDDFRLLKKIYLERLNSLKVDTSGVQSYLR